MKHATNSRRWFCALIFDVGKHSITVRKRHFQLARKILRHIRSNGRRKLGKSSHQTLLDCKSARVSSLREADVRANREPLNELHVCLWPRLLPGNLRHPLLQKVGQGRRKKKRNIYCGHLQAAGVSQCVRESAVRK